MNNNAPVQPAANVPPLLQQLPLSFDVLKPIEEIKATHGSIQDRFDAFHKANPHIYDYLKARAISLKHRGINRYGMKSLFELLRWDYAIQSGKEDSFKLNNNFTALYARKLMKEVAELRNFFATRTRRSE
jgi:hypothetical protein